MVSSLFPPKTLLVAVVNQHDLQLVSGVVLPCISKGWVTKTKQLIHSFF